MWYDAWPSFQVLSALLFGPDNYQEFPLCPCLPNQEACPAKWLDSGKLTAREGFVLQAHFDAGTRLRLYKKTWTPSTLKHGTGKKIKTKQAGFKLFTLLAPPILHMPRGDVALRDISQLTWEFPGMKGCRNKRRIYWIVTHLKLAIKSYYSFIHDVRLVLAVYSFKPLVMFSKTCKVA